MSVNIKRIIKKFFQLPYALIYLVYPVRYKKTIWLIGSGRSGTTWISSIINYRNTYRELFEPFHFYPFMMRLVGFRRNLYLDTEVKKFGFRFLARIVLRGKFYYPRTEENNKFIGSYPADYLLVKDIFANLFAHDIVSRDQRILPILLIRNPFAVALSMQEKKDWDWMVDPQEFLSQSRLKEKFLLPFEDLIQEVAKNGSYLDKQLLIWSVINYVPLKQFKEDQVLVTFYEDWLIEPNRELNRVYSFLGMQAPPFDDIRELPAFRSASKTSSNKTFDGASWKDKLTEAELNSGMEILRRFGFDKLYSERSIPDHEVIKGLQSS